jgi:ABC-type multidrug transport system fused ATPase/permease subunit
MGRILIAHQRQNNLSVALRQISSHHLRELSAIMAGKIMLGALDLLLAIALYRFVLLLQGNAQALQFSIFRIHLNFLSIALIVFVGFLVRMFGETITIRWMNNCRQALYAQFLTRLTEGYMAVDWITYAKYNRNDLVRHCLITAQDGAYAYQLIAEQITATAIVGILAMGCFIMGVIPATFLFIFLGCLSLLHRIVYREKLQVASRAREAALGRLQIGFAEMFESAKEIRAYKNFEYFRQRLALQINELGRNNSTLSSLPQNSRSYIEYGAMVVFTVVAIVAYLRKMNAQSLISMLVFYFILARRMLPMVSQLLMSMGQVDGAFDNISVVSRELANASQRKQVSSVDVKPSIGKVLEMNNVRFGYERDKNIVEAMTISVGWGEIVMLRGGSGAGKSTVLNLITGLLQQDAGDIYVDRSRLAYVPQDVILLDDTVRANILFGLRDVAEDQLTNALDVAQLLDFVRGLPAGLDTRVGDNGVLFSGGQRQRLGIARAVLRKPQLLLLDEATSSLDLESEEQVLTRLRHVMVEGAIVFVTHRAHTVLQGARVVSVRKRMSGISSDAD